MDNWLTKGCPLPVRVLGVLGRQALCKERAGSWVWTTASQSAGERAQCSVTHGCTRCPGALGTTQPSSPGVEWGGPSTEGICLSVRKDTCPFGSSRDDPASEPRAGASRRCASEVGEEVRKHRAGLLESPRSLSLALLGRPTLPLYF